MQVFINVLKNVAEAFDATEKRPDRALRIGARTLPPQTLEITFADNACGFDAPDGLLPVARGQTTKAAGWGVGLHASAEIIASHHGTFSLRSPGAGLGATCTLHLPLPSPSDLPAP